MVIDNTKIIETLESMIDKPVYVVSYGRAKRNLFKVTIIKSFMRPDYVIHRQLNLEGINPFNILIRVCKDYGLGEYNIKDAFLTKEDAEKYIHDDLSKRYNISGSISYDYYGESKGD